MTYDEIYSTARNWAESEIEAAGFANLPALWEPPYTTAARLVGAEHAEQCVALAKDAYARTRASLGRSTAQCASDPEGCDDYLAFEWNGLCESLRCSECRRWV